MLHWLSIIHIVTCFNMVQCQNASYCSSDIRGFLINKADNKLPRIPYNLKDVPNKQQYHSRCRFFLIAFFRIFKIQSIRTDNWQTRRISHSVKIKSVLLQCVIDLIKLDSPEFKTVARKPPRDWQTLWINNKS